MKHKKIRNLVSLLMNAEILISTIVCVIYILTRRTPVYFILFTTDSNVLAAVAAAVMLVFNIRTLFQPETQVPLAVSILKYITAVAVGLTFTIVLCFLAPMSTVAEQYSRTNFFFHLLNPLLAILSFVLAEYESDPLPWFSPLLAMLPTMAYGITYLVNVVFIGYENGGWQDFYMFVWNGIWQISFIAIHVTTLVISLPIFFTHNHGIKKKLYTTRCSSSPSL